MFVYLKKVTQVFVNCKKVVFLHTQIKIRIIKAVASLHLSQRKLQNETTS